MPVTWQSRETYPSSLHRNADLTIILLSKYREETFRIQLRSRSSLEEHKLRSSHIYTGQKSNFNLLTSVPPPNRLSSTPRRLPQPMSLAWRDGEVGLCTRPHGLPGCLLRNWFLSCLILSTEQSKDLGPLRQLETKKGSASPYSQQFFCHDCGKAEN